MKLVERIRRWKISRLYKSLSLFNSSPPLDELIAFFSVSLVGAGIFGGMLGVVLQSWLPLIFLPVAAVVMSVVKLLLTLAEVRLINRELEAKLKDCAVMLRVFQVHARHPLLVEETALKRMLPSLEGLLFETISQVEELDYKAASAEDQSEHKFLLDRAYELMEDLEVIKDAAAEADGLLKDRQRFQETIEFEEFDSSDSVTKLQFVQEAQLGLKELKVLNDSFTKAANKLKTSNRSDEKISS